MLKTQFISVNWVERAAWNPGLQVHSYSVEIDRRHEQRRVVDRASK